MNPKILKNDSNYDEWCEQEILNAYQQAAEADEFLFGDYDYKKEWLDNEGLCTLFFYKYLQEFLN